MMALRPAILLACFIALPAFAPGGASALLTPVSAQEEDPASVEHAKIASVKVDPATVKPGDLFHVVFNIKIAPEWHIYSANGTYSPTEWAFEGPVERAGKVEEPKPRHHREVLGEDDEGKEILIEYDYHEGDIAFRVPLRLKPDAKSGRLKLVGKMTGQECDPKICVGIDLNFTVDLTVAGEKTAGKTAQDEGHTKIVWVTAEPAQVKVGQTFDLVLKVAIEPTWHIYSANGKYNPTEWEFEAGAPVERVGEAGEPKPKHHRQDIAGEILEYDYHEGEFTFRVPVRLKAAAKPGPLTFSGKLIGQECDPKVCIPFEVTFPVQVTVIEGGVAAPPPPPPPPPPPQDDSVPDSPQSFLGLIILGILGGALSLIMPCVYPLLPVTLTYFIKQGGESRAKSVAMTTAYAAGIISVFTGVGFLFSILMGAEGPRIFAANPMVNLGVGLLFFWFAFSLLGLYEINLPSWMTGSFTSQQRSGVGGAFILGALFSVVTFTCTIPIAASILAVAATSGIENKFTGLVAMFVYSATMAAPFVVFGLFPSLIKEVPKSGGWLHTVKVTAGLAELALALMYFAVADQVTDTGILTRPVMIAVWVAVLGSMAFYLLGLFRMPEDGPPGPVGVPRILTSILFLGMAVYMAGGINSRTLGGLDIILPVAPPQEIGNYKDAIEEARRTKKPIFLEFTGFS